MTKQRKGKQQQRAGRPPGWQEATKRTLERVGAYERLTDEQILLKLANNPRDPEALLIFGDRHQKSISKLLCRLFGNNRLARRSLQPVLFHIASSARNYKPGELEPKEWIVQMAQEGGRVLYLLVQQHATNCAMQVRPISQIQEDFFASREIVH